MSFIFLGIALGFAGTYWAHGSKLKSGVIGKAVARIQLEMDERAKGRGL